MFMRVYSAKASIERYKSQNLRRQALRLAFDPRIGTHVGIHDEVVEDRRPAVVLG